MIRGPPTARHGRWPAEAVAVVAVVLVALTILTLELAVASEVGPSPIPPEVWVDDQGPVTPGAMGCRTTPGEVCFGFNVGVTRSGVALSGVGFEFAFDLYFTGGNPGAPVMPLGPGAAVTVVDSSGTAVGAWNWSSRSWVYGSNWHLPAGGSDVFVLDTGITEFSAVARGWFTVIVSAPNIGFASAQLPSVPS